MQIDGDRTVLSVEFPGLVKDVTRFMELIGGQKNLEKVYNSRSDRLELRFRPQDVYSHPVYGDKVKVEQILVKFVRKKITFSDGTVEMKTEARVIGVIEFAYQFQSLCDFQYLPMQKTDQSLYKSIINDLIPQNPLDPESGVKQFDANAPLLILPTIFSRFDMPIDYYYKSGPFNNINEEMAAATEKHRKQATIGRIRKSRASAGKTIAWFDLNERSLPVKPSDEAVQTYEKEVLNKNLLPKLKDLFDKRPVYTRNCLLYHMDCTSTELRYMLPLVAYYITDGPFKKTFVRLGFNPKAESNALQFQVIDFRAKKSETALKAKRTVFQYQLPLQRGEESSPRNRRFQQPPKIRQGMFSSSALEEYAAQEEHKKQDKRNVLWGQFNFKPGVLPTAMQINCQLVDIELDIVKSMISAGTQRREPDEKDGWLPAGGVEKIRSHMTQSLQMTVKSQPGPSRDDSEQQEDSNDQTSASDSEN